VKEKRLCVSENIVVLLVSFVYPVERCETRSKTNLGTSMRAKWDTQWRRTLKAEAFRDIAGVRRIELGR
jgi:hypothetical protein